MLCALLFTAAAAPAPAQSEPELERAYAQLHEALTREPRPTREERRELLRGFLDRHGEGSQREVLEARLRLASVYLKDMDGNEALREFAAVSATAGDHPSDLRARALYGMHQAQRLVNEPDAARETLKELLREFPGTPFARCARTAMAHMELGPPPGIGDPIPMLQMGRDVHGRPVPSSRQQPRLFVFWSIEHEPSLRRLEELALAWQKAGMPASALIAFALEEDAATLQRYAVQRQWPFVILPTDQGFLQSDWLALGVHAVPTVLLIGSDDKVLARDVSADRLQGLLGAGG